MNQILSFKTTENGKKIIMNNAKTFGICLTIFAIILIGCGAWRLYTNLNKKVDFERPEIVGHREGDKTVFNVKAPVGIQKIIYSWKNGEQNVIEKQGEKEFNFEIKNRIGVNELILKTVDSNGNSITYDNIKIVYDEYASEEDEDDGLGEIQDEDTPTEITDWEAAIANDKEKPTINLTAEKGKILIAAADSLKISYLTYSWNGGEEVKVTELSENEKLISVKIDALKGDNKLKIKAFDAAGNCKEIEKNVHGTDGPKISVKKSGNQLIVDVDNEYKITKIEYNFNNEEKTIDNIEDTHYSFPLDLVEGENFVIISAYEGSVKTEYRGKTTFKNQ